MRIFYILIFSEDESFLEPTSCKKPLTERLYVPPILCKIPNCLRCKLCFNDIMNVLFIPCGHIVTCIQCSLTLKCCPMCNQKFNNTTYFLRVFIQLEDKDARGEENEHLKTSSFEKPTVNPLLCKICQKNTMVAYAPCRHVYSCGECTLTLSKRCPICTVDLLGMIQISFNY